MIFHWTKHTEIYRSYQKGYDIICTNMSQEKHMILIYSPACDEYRGAKMENTRIPKLLDN